MMQLNSGSMVQFVIALSQGTNGIGNIFQLVGRDENAITTALAWSLKSSPTFFAAFVQQCSGYIGSLEGAQLHLQRNERARGRTDLEIVVPGGVHLILEAKIGWEIPSGTQLHLYTGRSAFATGTAAVKKIVTMSEADAAFATHYLPSTIDGVPTHHISRRDVHRIATSVADSTKGMYQKNILRAFAEYLNNTMRPSNVSSNLAYVVSLSWAQAGPMWPGTTFVDVVVRHSRYYHPMGGAGERWPAIPPNYLAFRYGGQLQSIRHVESFVVTRDLGDVAPGVLASFPQITPHFLYTLGPEIMPAGRIIKTGDNIQRAARVSAAIDLLLTSKTISEAWVKTKARLP